MRPLLLIVLLIVGTISPAEGQLARDLALFRNEGGSIHGHVIQPDGNRLPGVTVELVKAVNRNGLRLLMATGEKVETDASGEYRFNAAPGEYYVRTVSNKTHLSVRWYFPGSTDPEGAVPINVTPGADVSADIGLSETPVFKISIRVIESLPDPGDRYVTAFYLINRNSSIREVAYAPGVSGCLCPDSSPHPESKPFVRASKDRFEIRGVRPGSYELIATMLIGNVKPDAGLVMVKAGEPSPFWMVYEGQTMVEVKDADVDGGTVKIHHGVDLKGKFTSIGKFHSKGDPCVYLADERGNTPMLADVNHSWKFILRNVPAGRHTFSFGFLPDGAYVAEVRQGGRILSDSAITVGSSSVEPIEVILKPGGVIEGRIDNGEGTTVLLVPVSPQNNIDRGGRADYVRKSGEFKFQGLPQGEYRVYAINLSSVDESYVDPVFMSKYESQGIPVTVVPGIPLTVQPAWINP